MEREAARSAVRLAIQAEMSHRGWNITQLRDASEVDAGTLGDFLAGNRWPRMRTLGRIEHAVGWPPGTIVRMLDGEPAPPVGGDTQDAAHEEDALLYRRPEGLSDDEWEALKQETREFIEWQIERAARER